MYSGFELCEAARACRAARNIWIPRNTRSASADFDAPGNIVAEIARLNRIRKAHPALQSHLGLRFYTAYNDQIIFYGKAAAGRRQT